MSSPQQLAAQQQSQLAPSQQSQVAKRDASDLDAFARRPFVGDMLSAFGLGDVGRSLDRQLARAEANVPRLLVDVVEKCVRVSSRSVRARVGPRAAARRARSDPEPPTPHAPDRPPSQLPLQRQ